MVHTCTSLILKCQFPSYLMLEFSSLVTQLEHPLENRVLLGQVNQDSNFQEGGSC